MGMRIDYDPVGALQSAGAVPKTLRGAITYAAGTTGAIGATSLFTVTGDVSVTFLAAKCTTDLTSGGVATFDVGVTGNAQLFFATAPDVTGWDVGEWLNPIGTTYSAGGAPNLLWNTNHTPADISANIIQTIATATITGGVVRWYVSYIPLSADGAIALHANLVAF